MVGAQRRAHESDDAGARFQMPEMALRRTDAQGPSTFAENGGGDRAGLDRIAHRRAGAVRLHVHDPFRAHAGAIPQRLQQFDLPLAGRHGQARGPAVLVDRRADNPGVHAPQRLDRPLGRTEQHGAAAFAAHESVGPGVERRAATRRGQHLRAGEAQERERAHQCIHAEHERQVALPGAQALAGQMQRRQGRRTGGIQGDAGTLQIQGIGNSVGDDRERAAGHRVPRRVRRVAERHRLVLGQARAHEHADAPSGQTLGVDIGVEYRLVRDFKRQPLLRVELRRLPGRDPKIQRVKTIDAVQPPGARGNRPVRLPGDTDKVVLLQPMLGDLADGGIPGLHARPQLPRAADIARVATTDSDHFDHGHESTTELFPARRLQPSGAIARVHVMPTSAAVLRRCPCRR